MLKTVLSPFILKSYSPFDVEVVEARAAVEALLLAGINHLVKCKCVDR